MNNLNATVKEDSDKMLKNSDSVLQDIQQLTNLSSTANTDHVKYTESNTSTPTKVPNKATKIEIEEISLDSF